MPVETIGEVTARLDEEGIPYRLDAGGARLTVQESELARARVLLAREGLPAAGRPGFELFDQPSWGMTDFTQRVNYRRALEGELERTIGQMTGVEAAQVHLALQESSFIRRANRPAEASVVVSLHSGMRPEAGMVEGIAFLVASSVEGMESDNVTVLDDGGRLLTAGPDLTTAEGMTNRQLEVRREVEQYLEGKALELLTPVVGTGNADVRVSVDLNFDRIDRTVQTFDPDQQVTLTEETSEIIPSTEEQGAASATSNATFEVGKSVESLSRGGARIERITTAVLVNDRPVIPPDGEGEVTYEPRSAQELSRLEALVRNAVGINQGRGDAISVVNVPFDLGQPDLMEEESLDLAGMIYAAQRPAVAVFGVLMTFFLVLRLIGTIKALPVREAPAPLAPAPEQPAVRPMPESAPLIQQAPQPTHVPKGETTVPVPDPGLTARVVKAWMSEA
jgi:flagellar M-ring protein FliF